MNLFPYQKVGANFLEYKKVALLSDEMGLGKSAQAIAACDAVKAERVLVVCPAVARVNWAREFEKFSNHPRQFDVVTNKRQTFMPGASAIISYDLAASCPALLSGEFDALILDEVHYLKSLDTKRTKAVFGVNGLVRRAKRVWALSATPAPNDVSELWPLLYTFGATPLLYPQFVNKFCQTMDSPFGLKIIGNRTENLPELKKILANVMLRRKKTEVLKELPPITFGETFVEAGEVLLEQAEIDEILHEERNMGAALKLMPEEQLRVLEALAGSMSTLRRYNGLKKIRPAIDLISAELAAKSYEKIVIFTIHRDVTLGLLNGLHAFSPVGVYGGTAPTARQRAIDSFQNDPKTRVFVGNIAAAGTAITLTAAHNVVFVEQDWTPGNNAQAAMRCHRIGQANPVCVRILSVADSLDAQINAILRRKSRDLLEFGL